MIPLGGVLLNDRTTSALPGQSGLEIRVAVVRFRPTKYLIYQSGFSSARTYVCRNGGFGPSFGPANCADRRL